MKFRTPLLSLVLLLAPQLASADYLDVIVNKLNDGCSMEKYMKNVGEFRGVMKSEGYTYTVEIATPFTNDVLDVIYWIGREPNFGTFGAENDRWIAAVAKGGTPEAKISDKLGECATNVSRSGSQTR